MLVLILGPAVLAAAVLVVIRRCLSAVDRLSVQIGDIDEQVRTWQHAHDHQVAELHRRLEGIERTATRTAEQGLALSGGLTDLNAVLTASFGATEARRPSNGVAS